MKRILFFLITLCVLTSACKKEKEDAATPAVIQPTSKMDTTAATPGDPVVILFTNAPSQNSFQIVVGGMTVTMVKTGPNEFQFIMPVVSPGVVAIDLSAANVEDPLSLEILSYTVISDPAPIIADYKNRLDAAVAYTQKYSEDTIRPVSYENVLMVESFRDNINATFLQLTPAEKIEAAYFLQKVEFDTLDFYALRRNSSRDIASPFRTTAGDRSNRFMAIGEAFVTSNIITAASIGISYIGFIAPEPSPVTKIIGLVAGATAAVGIVVSFKLIDMLAEEIGVQFSFENLIAKTASGSDVTLRNNITLPVQFNSNYRRLLTSDESGSSSFIRNVFTSLNSLRDKYNGFRNKVNQLTNWFPIGKPELAEFVSPIETSIVSATRPTPSENLTLTNVSNSQISLTYVRNGNTINITTTSTTVTTDTDFTFDVVYNNSELGITTRKTMNATFDPSSLEIGQTYAGGIIFYLDATGEHGMVVAPTNQGSAEWGCYGSTLVGADGSAIGTGYQNTIDIINGCTEASIAAKLCYDLTLNGYSDWFLPSEKELLAIYENLHVNGLGGFNSTTRYWSSTELNSMYALYGRFDIGEITANLPNYRNSNYTVRAVRSF